MSLCTALRYGGALLMSLFAGPRLESMPHPVITASRWPIVDLAREREQVSFKVTAHHRDPRFPHTYLTAGAMP